MSITAISPIDGRYESKTQLLQSFFSEHALIKYRVYVEIEYLKALSKSGIDQLQLTESDCELLDQAGAQHEHMRRYDRVTGSFAEGVDQKLRCFHRYVKR